MARNRSLDLGHYMKTFLDEEELTQTAHCSTKVIIILKVIEDERSGAYQGQTVRIVPRYEYDSEL